ncbi:MAG: response regulator [Blastocatellia bacterium]
MMNAPSPLPPVVLLIEDSDEDYTAFARAIRLTGLEHTLHRCRDGDEALAFLFQQGPHAGPRTTPRPSLILLDLNLPGTDGREVLARVKRDERLRAIPLIVLTTSANPQDIHECYRQGANSYQVKSANYEGFKGEVQRTVDYWFRTAVTPASEE